MEELNRDLVAVLDHLNEIHLDNFEDKINLIDTLINRIEKKKNFLKKNFKVNDLKTNCDAANTTVKHIYSKVDSMIEIRKEQQKKIRNELSEIINKKKLINYQR